MKIDKRNEVIAKIERAKDIIAEIYLLTHSHNNKYIPTGYGNYELNQATDSMYKYIKQIEDGCDFCLTQTKE